MHCAVNLNDDLHLVYIPMICARAVADVHVDDSYSSTGGVSVVMFPTTLQPIGPPSLLSTRPLSSYFHMPVPCAQYSPACAIIFNFHQLQQAPEKVSCSAGLEPWLSFSSPQK